ncbi:hypothetical protein [Micromonospora sp. LOL_021]|uniref:hypothetical protein n=1 Tax=Micromonospora sp. LOL_021 TaxID=3345417 RepID=UPI003A877935
MRVTRALPTLTGGAVDVAGVGVEGGGIPGTLVQHRDLHRFDQHTAFDLIAIARQPGTLDEALGQVRCRDQRTDVGVVVEAAEPFQLGDLGVVVVGLLRLGRVRRVRGGSTSPRWNVVSWMCSSRRGSGICVHGGCDGALFVVDQGVPDGSELPGDELAEAVASGGGEAEPELGGDPFDGVYVRGGGQVVAFVDEDQGGGATFGDHGAGHDGLAGPGWGDQ